MGTIFGVIKSGPRYSLTRKSDIPVRELFLNNDHRIDYLVEERTTGILITGLQLSASLSLTPTGTPAASGSVTLSIGLEEDPPCSGEYVGVFSGADLTAVLSSSIFGISGSKPGTDSLSPGVYEIITSGSHIQVSSPLTLRSARIAP